MKLLIETPTWLGDAVMATPAIENIANFYKDPEITLIGSLTSIEVLKNNPKISKTYILRKNYFDLIKLSKKLGHFDVFFSFRSSLTSTILKLVVSSNRKYQYQKSQYIDGHQVEKYNNFVNNSLSTNYTAGKLLIYSNNSRAGSDASQLKMGINPGATYGDAKRWSPKEFSKVAIALSSTFKIIIFGGPGEESIAKEIEKILINNDIKNYENLAGSLSIQELISSISSLDLFISGDSGPMHIAAGFKIPTVAIFGPTNDIETSQWMNKKSIVIKKNLDCQPCMKRACKLKHNNCMKLIEAQEVIQSIPIVFPKK